MIIDKETNFVYFSSLIKRDKKYELFWVKLKELLSKNRIAYGFIENTRSIWCRDYMPIQKSENEFIQYDYYPDYLIDPKFISELTIPSEIRVVDVNTNSIRKSELIIDGGNIVKSKAKVILTEKIFHENRKLSHEKIKEILSNELSAEVFIIPTEPSDFTGHADGMVRFYDEKTLLVNDYSFQPNSWKRKMDEALENTGLDIVNFTYSPSNEKNKDGDYTAIGNYINFAQIGNVILFPVYGLPNEIDIKAQEQIMSLYPKCEIALIDAIDIAENGGVLNCITWNIKITPRMNFEKPIKKDPDFDDQKKYVYSKLDFYLSTYDYELMEGGFAQIWNDNNGAIIGDGDLKNLMYKFLEPIVYENPIPQSTVDRTVDLILEYLESIGQYGMDFSEN
jgi:agmatine deiminase